MKNKNKNTTTTTTFKNMVFKVVALFAAFVSTMLITRIVVAKCGSGLYGFYSLSIDFVNYAMLISVALNSMASRYITISYYRDDRNKVKTYFSSVFFANIVLAIVLFTVGIIVIANLDRIVNIPEGMELDVQRLFAFVFLNFIITIIFSVFSVATFINNRVDIDSIRQTESYLIQLILVIVLFFNFKPRIAYLGMAVFVAGLYVGLINVRYTKKLAPDLLPIKTSYISFERIREIISSGMWNSVTRIGAIILNGLDLMIANILISPQAMGVLSVSKTLPKYFLSAIQGFATIFSPSITIAYAQNDTKQVIKNINFSIKMCAIVTNVIAVIAIFLGRRIYEVWMPEQNPAVLQLLSAVAMLGYIVVMPLEPLWTVFTVVDKVKVSSLYLIIESIVAIATVFSLLQIVPHGVWQLIVIAGVSSFFETLRGMIFLPISCATYLKVSKITFYRTIGRSLLAFSIISLLTIAMEKLFTNGILELLSLIILVVVFSGIVDWVVVLNKNERSIVAQKIFKKFN